MTKSKFQAFQMLFFIRRCIDFCSDNCLKFSDNMVDALPVLPGTANTALIRTKIIGFSLYFL